MHFFIFKLNLRFIVILEMSKTVSKLKLLLFIYNTFSISKFF